MANIILHTSIIQDGISYQRPLNSGVSVSYQDNDEYWNTVNNPYSISPPYPINYAVLDTYNTLVNVNAFGDLNRFTDENGLQVYGNNYVIDHLTGLGITLTPVTALFNFNDSVIASTNFTLLGYSDFRLPSRNELTSIMMFHTAGDRDLIQYAPFNFVSGNFISTNTTDAQLSTSNIMSNAVKNTLYLGYSKTTAYTTGSFYFRNHY